MNTTARRIVTTLAGVGLAASAVAATGPAAHAGKPSGGTTPIAVVYTGSDSAGQALYVNYKLPAVSADITSITCTFDGVPLTSCGLLSGEYKKTSAWWTTNVQEAGSTDQHTFTVTATTKQATFTGSLTFAWQNPYA